MILNVSGRTDIVAFYSEWFMNRYRDGFVDVRNPFHPKLVSRIFFEDVDAILFCTKNPIPILKNLKEIQKPILFHVTLTPYHQNIEPNVPTKGKIIDAIKALSLLIGKEHLWIRYDPIFLSHQYTLSYHKKAFSKMCQLLDGYVEHIIVSFLDDYQNVRKNMNVLQVVPFCESDYEEIGTIFAEIARKHQMTIQTCFEERNLSEYGFQVQDCLSKSLAYELTGKKYPEWKARRGNHCHCVQMVDIGVYNTCFHLCRYCYANFDEKQIAKNRKLHDPSSSLLIGCLHEDDVLKVRKK